MCKAYTDVGGIKQLYHVYLPVRKIIHSLKHVDYLHVQGTSYGINCLITVKSALKSCTLSSEPVVGGYNQTCSDTLLGYRTS